MIISRGKHSITGMEQEGRGRRHAPRTRANRPEVIRHRGEIIGRYKSGQSLKEISRQMAIHIKSVRLWVKRYEAEGHVETRPRPGRPRVTSPDDDRRLISAAEQCLKKTTVKKATVTLTRELGLQCHVSTARRRLHDVGIHCYIPAIKEELTDIHQAARLQFAEQYADIDHDFWRTVIFTDKTTFSSMSAPARQCWRRRGCRFNEENICERSKSGRVSLAMYGWMWYGGPGELLPLKVS